MSLVGKPFITFSHSSLTNLSISNKYFISLSNEFKLFLLTSSNIDLETGGLEISWIFVDFDFDFKLNKFSCY